MPVGVKCKTVRSGYDGRGNAEILQLGSDACDATAAAHDAPVDGRARLLARAFDLRTRARRHAGAHSGAGGDGWEDRVPDREWAFVIRRASPRR
jgi:hypothetical protein